MEPLAYAYWVRYWEKINESAIHPTALVINGIAVKPVVFPPSIDAMESTIVP
jgi:preprotein translocase subunit Sec61beta